MRRTFLIALLALAAVALLAPAPASAQRPPDQEDLECLENALGINDLEDLIGDVVDDPLTPVDERAEALEKALQRAIDQTEECIRNFFPGLDRDFCDDCDPTFDFDEIREAILEFNQGRALRQRLQECRDRTLNQSHSADSQRDCQRLTTNFELYINDEGSLEARAKSGEDQVSNDDPAGPGECPTSGACRADLRFRSASPQQVRGGLDFSCASSRGGPCRVDVLARGVLIASGSRVLAPGAPATLNLRVTRRGTALLRRSPRVRAQVLTRVPGAFGLGRITIRR